MRSGRPPWPICRERNNEASERKPASSRAVGLFVRSGRAFLRFRHIHSLTKGQSTPHYLRVPAGNQSPSTPETCRKRQQETRSMEQQTVRINKALADAGVCSRRKADETRRRRRGEGQRGNSRVPGLQIRPGIDRIEVNGRQLKSDTRPPCYLMLHKPVRVVSTARDPEGRMTVLDLVSLPMARTQTVPGRTSGFLFGRTCPAYRRWRADQPARSSEPPPSPRLSCSRTGRREGTGTRCHALGHDAGRRRKTRAGRSPRAPGRQTRSLRAEGDRTGRNPARNDPASGAEPTDPGACAATSA